MWAGPESPRTGLGTVAAVGEWECWDGSSTRDPSVGTGGGGPRGVLGRGTNGDGPRGVFGKVREGSRDPEDKGPVEGTGRDPTGHRHPPVSRRGWGRRREHRSSGPGPHRRWTGSHVRPGVPRLPVSDLDTCAVHPKSPIHIVWVQTCLGLPFTPAPGRRGRQTNVSPFRGRTGVTSTPTRSRPPCPEESSGGFFRGRYPTSLHGTPPQFCVSVRHTRGPVTSPVQTRGGTLPRVKVSSSHNPSGTGLGSELMPPVPLRGFPFRLDTTRSVRRSGTPGYLYRSCRRVTTRPLGPGLWRHESLVSCRVLRRTTPTPSNVSSGHYPVHPGPRSHLGDYPTETSCSGGTPPGRAVQSPFGGPSAQPSGRAPADEA